MTQLPIRFVLTFILVYLSLQIFYTGYLWWYEPQTDFFTRLIANILLSFFDNTSLVEIPEAAKVQFLIQGKAMVNISEGCNGLSVIIALFSFIISFRGSIRKYLWFIPLSFLFLSLCNLLRLFLLIRIKQYYPEYFDFFHEYIFPAVLYLAAFLMMVIWTRENLNTLFPSGNSPKAQTDHNRQS